MTIYCPAYFEASSKINLVDSKPPPERYHKSEVSVTICPFLPAFVSCRRLLFRISEFCVSSPPIASGRSITKMKAGVTWFTL